MVFELCLKFCVPNFSQNLQCGVVVVSTSVPKKFKGVNCCSNLVRHRFWHTVDLVCDFI